MYILSGTHSTMFPQAAPANVPVEVLIKMGSQLLNIVDKKASSGKMFPSYSNQFSPTSSTADEEEWNMKYPSIILQDYANPYSNGYDIMCYDTIQIEWVGGNTTTLVRDKIRLTGEKGYARCTCSSQQFILALRLSQKFTIKWKLPRSRPQDCVSNAYS